MDVEHNPLFRQHRWSLPVGWLTFDASGNLYGTTRTGGTSNTGTVFELAPQADGSWTETVLHNFQHSGGTLPNAGVIFDAAGNLYGTTPSNGDTCGCKYGTVFQLTRGTHGTWTATTLHTFVGTDGDAPMGVTLDAAGKLYGVTFVGGSSNDGVVFRLSPSSGGKWVETGLHVFGGKDGAGPVGALIVDTSGNLYGASGYGGPTNNDGTVFVLRSTPAIDGNY
jgi:uncharacterized repeat protein (TIGR03803 family)